MKISLANSRVELTNIGNGVFQYTLFVKETVHPLGWCQVVFSKAGDKVMAEVLFVYVIEKARGSGISECLQQELFKHCDIIVSGKGTKEGENKKRRLGWSYSKELNLYYIICPPKFKEEEGKQTNGT